MRCAVERREIMYCKKFVVRNYMNMNSRVSYASKKGQRSLMGPNSVNIFGVVLLTLK